MCVRAMCQFIGNLWGGAGAFHFQGKSFQTNLNDDDRALCILWNQIEKCYCLCKRTLRIAHKNTCATMKSGGQRRMNVQNSFENWIHTCQAHEWIEKLPHCISAKKHCPKIIYVDDGCHSNGKSVLAILQLKTCEFGRRHPPSARVRRSFHSNVCKCNSILLTFIYSLHITVT